MKISCVRSFAAQSASPLSRRKFVAALGALSLPLLLPARLFGKRAPSNRITLGFIGTGAHGIAVNLRNFLNEEDAHVLAVCDVKEPHAAGAKNLVDQKYGNKDCTMYRDFRSLIDRKDIDAIVISTPDHWHVPMSLRGLKAGKHVFSEKPTLTLSQGRQLVNAVKEACRVFQWGLEDRSMLKYRMLTDWARNGAIGKVERVFVRLPEYGGSAPYPLEEPTRVPPDLDWNLWLGPAPFHPYNPNRTENHHWRKIFDYSGGVITDWGAHLVDTAQVGASVDATGPISIEGTGIIPRGMQSNVPSIFNLRYTYANGVVLHVKNATGDPDGCVRFEGSKGWVSCTRWDGLLEASSKEILRTRYTAGQPGYRPRPPREQRNFLDCIHSGKPATYFPEAGHRLFSTLHLGHLAIRSGKNLKWDPVKEVLLNADDVHDDGILTRPARDWEKA